MPLLTKERGCKRNLAKALKLASQIEQQSSVTSGSDAKPVVDLE
jgi:hypothetical protein